MKSEGRRTEQRALMLLAALVGILGLLGVGCGLSTSDRPEPISEDNVPPDLREPRQEDTQQSTSLGGLEMVPVWFVRVDEEGTQLEPVERGVLKPGNAARRLGALLSEGPTEAENREGLASAIPAETGLAQPPERRETTLVVSLTSSFFELQGASARNAFAQLVFTATELPGVESVQFMLDGSVVPALDGEGQSRDNPLGRCDYDNLVPSC